MKTKAQEWFLLKKNWMDDLKNLSNEEFGTVVRALYTSGAPDGALSIVYGLLKDEFDRVNQSREEGLAKRREASARGVLARTGSLPDVAPEVSPVVNRTHTHTDTSTDTISTGLKELSSLKLSELDAYDKLMNGNFLE